MAVMNNSYESPGPPWGWQPSLKILVEDMGVDFDALIAHFKYGFGDEEIAAALGTNVKAISHFREHFEKYGIDSVMGQD